MADPTARTSHELDPLVRGAVGRETGVLLSVGEAKGDPENGYEPSGRLRYTLTLLKGKEVDTILAKPACYSGAGFTEDPRAAEKRGEVILVDRHRLHEGE
ncbi:hypothetical protein I3F58_00010 [Streptomyces sp. MUM 203J]|uniref:hypothetical protein n=1 Tax=Streptomyces sp. MUM 203J TaxID=2791990 RepID=UPI001F036DE4|nr:hypothetical protein [Streptomyces sp. MUM 203J]MCH0537968.1 hypothetical protein [Streptomyces sp. MUM 203J]